MTYVSFWVAGIPVQQGSMKAFVAGGKARVTHTNSKGLNAWRDAIATEARAKFTTVTTGPILVTLDFRMPRPKSLPKRKYTPHIKTPDIDKLARSGLDAMAGVVYNNDSQVDHLMVYKRYAEIDEQPGVKVSVRRDDE